MATKTAGSPASTAQMPAPTAHVHPRPLAPKLLLDQAVDLAAVGAALGLLHHRTDDRADGLLIAGTNLLGRLGICLDRGGDDRLQLAAVGDLSKALMLDD